MRVYVGIDLHSNNNYLVIIDENGKIRFSRRLANDLNLILRILEPFKEQIEGIVVESTYNWYWLVDGLVRAGFRCHLANTSAIKQYEGLKHTDDKSDARWLAQMLHLGILPEGYIYPPNERAIRDLLRKRAHLVRQHTSNVLSIKNICTRNTGVSLDANRLRAMQKHELEELFDGDEVKSAVVSTFTVIKCLKSEIANIEKTVQKKMRLNPQFKQLLTVDGIGNILGLTISLETGDISRFPTAGKFSSYCRCVGSTKTSNGKNKGKGNTKNGNKYLAWAFFEAASCAKRRNALARKFYQRKCSKSHHFVAMKALANKLARASYYIMRDNVPFDEAKAFG